MRMSRLRKVIRPMYRPLSTGNVCTAQLGLQPARPEDESQLTTVSATCSSAPPRSVERPAPKRALSRAAAAFLAAAALVLTAAAFVVGRDGWPGSRVTELRSTLSELRASRLRILSAADRERRRIERDLHDGAQQRLVTLSVSLGLAAARADLANSGVLARSQDEVEQAIAELRELARGIHPTLLRQEGLRAAVEALARRSSLPVTVEGSIRERLPDAVELAAYFLVSEALTNVVKHAAASRATVRLERHATSLRVVVADDGQGGAHFAPDSGLAGLRDRLEALDAPLVVESEPDRGTSISAEIPCVS